MRILLIEDNQSLCQTISRHLKKAGYELDTCLDGQEGLNYALSSIYDLVILDCLLPSLNGVELLQIIRSKNIHTPVIMTTALCDIDDRVTGLDAGADDYLTKPFAMQELLARIRALSRRPNKIDNCSCLTYSNITFNLNTLALTGPILSCSLSKRESDLLEYFMRNPTKLLSRKLIFFKIWGPDAPVEEGNLDNYIRFLRRRLNSVGSKAKIKTVRSVGYILEEEDA